MSLSFNVIAAIDLQRGIGKGGGLPWHLPGDMKHFKIRTTTTRNPEKQNAVMMGRKTWDSIPEKFRPLPDRINLVLTQNPQQRFPPGVLFARSLKTGFSLLGHTPDCEGIFVIGGAHVFEAALQMSCCEKLYLTQINTSFECDTFFPDFEGRFKRKTVSETFWENGISYCFSEYEQRVRPSMQD